MTFALTWFNAIPGDKAEISPLFRGKSAFAFKTHVTGRQASGDEIWLELVWLLGITIASWLIASQLYKKTV